MEETIVSINPISQAMLQHAVCHGRYDRGRLGRKTQPCLSKRIGARYLRGAAATVSRMVFFGSSRYLDHVEATRLAPEPCNHHVSSRAPPVASFARPALAVAGFLFCCLSWRPQRRRPKLVRDICCTGATLSQPISAATRHRQHEEAASAVFSLPARIAPFPTVRTLRPI
jgi:hypothetical protein